MEKIKVNDYIRTPYFTIEKVVKIQKPKSKNVAMVITDCDAYQLKWLEFHKVKHSSNIIDLIQERRLCEWI